MEDPKHFSDNSTKPKGTFNRWVFTLNNYTDEEVKRVTEYPDFVRYVCYGKEVGDKGTPHLQGFVVTWQAVRLSQFKLWMRRAHFEPMISSLENNERYCQKQGDYTELGSRPQQGRRTDIIGVKRRIDAGEELSVIQEDESTFNIVMRNQRALAQYEANVRCKRMRTEGRKIPEVYIRIGPTRSGKTSYVYERHGYHNVYACPSLTGQWFDNYRGEPVMLFDDVEADKVPPVEFFKRITDGYPLQIPVKGAFTYCRPDYIYFTSNHRVQEWWPKISNSDWSAIKERITQIVTVYKHRPDVIEYERPRHGEIEEIRREEVVQEEVCKEGSSSICSQASSCNSSS